MNEQQFLLKLEERAHEQEKIISHLRAPQTVFGISMWLGRHPWRFMIPLSFIFSIILQSIFGNNYTETILWIFGGL